MNRKKLNEILKINQLLESNLRQKKELEERKDTLPSPMNPSEKVSTSTISNTVQQYVLNLVNLEELINKEIDSLTELKINAKKSFEKLNMLERTVMEMRYLECMDWDELSYKIGYSESHAMKIHQKALKNLEVYNGDV